MKALLAALLALTSTTLHAQHIRFGAEAAVTQNTQLFFSPARPGDGTTQMEWKRGFSAAAYARWENILDVERGATDLRASLGYFRKGCSTPYQTAGEPVPGTSEVPLNYNRASTTLDYLTIDAMLQQSVARIGGLTLVADAGLGANLLLGSDIRAGLLQPNGGAYFVRTYDDRTAYRCNLSYTLGLEARARAGFSVFVRTAQSLSPVFLSSDLRVKDWSWVYGLSVDIFRKAVGRVPGRGDAAE